MLSGKKHETQDTVSEPPGPLMVRLYVCPTIPSGERLQCQSCLRVAIPGHTVVHSDSCAWLRWQGEKPLGEDREQLPSSSTRPL